MLLPTTKETPSDAEIVSHQLMLRAGMIRKLAGGIYSYLPLGYKIIKKIEAIIREEMDRAGGQEIFMPAVQPAELWQQSGRWNKYGKELLRFKDRHNRDYCIGPTHEEVVTDIVRNEIQTYRQLPLNLYQIQTKFRDEIRPRFGVMRSREFSMKDAYSFDRNEQGAALSYRKMFHAYERIFKRCGFRFRAVEADSGNIGGSYSHEFMVTADSGEDAMIYCTSCNYAANLEKAEAAKPELQPANEKELLPCEEVYTPDVKNIEEVSEFLSVRPGDVVKTLIFTADNETLAVLIRGDKDVNEIKLNNFLNAESLELATDEIIYKTTGSPRGFAGPIGLKCRILADYSLIGMKNFVIGANKENYHRKNCNAGRDFTIHEYADLKIVSESDRCPRCKGEMQLARGIEVGHVFKLGEKYSKAMNATFLDDDGKEKYMIMGCYGIGVSRMAAASIEQSHDDDGIIWPMSITPFQIIVTPVNMNDEEIAKQSEAIYARLKERGLEVLFDDRDERAGVKFKDADLIGIPIRITVGAKRLKEGNVEVKFRDRKELITVPLGEIETFIDEAVRSRIEECEA
jgi:prolyl-tRNA synthetase